MAIRVTGDLVPPKPDNVATDENAGEFSLDPSQANDLYARLGVILDDLRSLRGDAEALMHMQPPADEPVSKNFNRALVGEGDADGVFNYAVGHIDREISYLAEFKRRLGESLDSTESMDEANKRDFHRRQDGDIEGTY